MITTTTGDILQSEAQTLVNTVNTVGIMGKGIAAAFKQRYPAMFKDYKRRCDKPDGDPAKVRLGEPYLWRPISQAQLEFDGPVTAEPGDLKWILNFPTKDHWRGASRLDAIEQGLNHLIAHYADWGIESIAVPPLGCGLGGLEWRVVGPQLYRRLSELTIPVELYAPLGTPLDELDEDFLRGTGATISRDPTAIDVADLVVAITAFDVAELFGVDGLNQSQTRSIGYLLHQTGIPTSAEFVRDKYGVRDVNFTHVMSQFEHNGVVSSVKRGRARLNVPGPTADDARRLAGPRAEQWRTNVVTVQTVASALGLARLARVPEVHWMATNEWPNSIADTAAAESNSRRGDKMIESTLRQHGLL